MSKVIDLNQTVYELCTINPDIKQVLSEIGFTDILKPGMINTAGRFMTIPKGAALKKIDFEMIINTFKKHGFDVIC